MKNYRLQSHLFDQDYTLEVFDPRANAWLPIGKVMQDKEETADAGGFAPQPANAPRFVAEYTRPDNGRTERVAPMDAIEAVAELAASCYVGQALYIHMVKGGEDAQFSLLL